jgi:ABC-type amino acid transport substrate-binding protein
MQIGLVPNEHNSTVNRWRFVMKTLLTLGAALAVLLLIAMPVASQAPQADKSFSGTLTKVDAAKKVITVKGTGAEPEMTFTYDDKTQVTGAEKTVEGLTGKTGAVLKVTYQEKGADRIATRIEVSEAKK